MLVIESPQLPLLNLTNLESYSLFLSGTIWILGCRRLEASNRNTETKRTHVSASNLFCICIVIFVFSFVDYPLYISGFPYFKRTELFVCITVHPKARLAKKTLEYYLSKTWQHDFCVCSVKYLMGSALQLYIEVSPDSSHSYLIYACCAIKPH
jgi:hypothetical protein